MTKLFPFINRKKKMFEKLNMILGPSYKLSKIKANIIPRSTYPNTLNSEARLRNEKVLDTHSAQKVSCLLDSYDQCTPFMHAMNNMLYT